MVLLHLTERALLQPRQGICKELRAELGEVPRQRRGRVSVSPIGTIVWASMGPASIACTIRMIVTPVVSKPCAIAS